MNKREAAIVTAFTGILMGKFSDFHEYAEKIMEHAIWTHQFGSKETTAKIKEAAKPDFLALCENLDEAP